MKRLENFERLVPPAAPADLDHPGDHRAVLMHMRNNLRQTVAPELIEDRLDLFVENLGRMNNPPAWTTLEPPKDLVCWKWLLEEHMRIEQWAVEPFIELVRGGRLGYQEACRILAHLVKDSDSGSTWSSSSSKWLYRCCHEALEAIRNWQDWDSEHLKGKGKGHDKGSSSSSSSAWTSCQPPTSNQRGFR